MFFKSAQKCLVVVLLLFQLNPIKAQYPYNPIQPELGLPSTIRIGALFDENEPAQETMLKLAIERINADRTVLPRSQLSAQIERIRPGDAHQAASKLCELMGGGIAAVFGPQSAASASHVQSIADAFEVPHVETKWDYKIRKENYLFNLAVHPGTLSKAYQDLVEALGWDKFIILYENEESLFLSQDLLKFSGPKGPQATFIQLPSSSSSSSSEEEHNFRPVLRQILRSPEKIYNIVIDCSTPNLRELFKQAQQVGLMSYHYSFLLTSFDLQSLELEQYKYSEVNITAFRMVDPERAELKGLLGELQQTEPLSRTTITTGDALIYDAVQSFSKALHVLDSSQRIEVRPLNCSTSSPWPHGYSIINYMKMVQFQGLTGLIQFDTSGYRSDVQLDVIQLTQEGISKIGIWDSKFVSKFGWVRPKEDFGVVENDQMPLHNRTLRITTILNKPLCMYKISKKALYGNDQFEGFSIDLAEELSKILKFKYTIQLVADGSYGGYDNVSGWNGMIREVLDNKADIVIADYAVTKQREQAVDFSMPFMNLGISILFTKPQPKAPSLYSFLSPFSPDVWVFMCLSFVGVSVVMFITARLSPYEWDCPHPCIEDPDELLNQFNVLNSFWMTVGSIMQQGSDLAPKVSEWTNKERNDLSFSNTIWIVMTGLLRHNNNSKMLPKAASTRIVAGTWWFFTLIMVSSYTANLASFLLVADLEDTIKGLDDLKNQTKVRFGCVFPGSTANFFKNNKPDLWKQMMEMQPSPFVSSNLEGINQVLSAPGKYAFFMENTLIEYNAERNCNLTQVGDTLDSKGYAVAMRKQSNYRQQFNQAVLQLQEKGTLNELKRKWWKEQRKGEQCLASGTSDVNPLALKNVGGVFVVLVAGCLIAFVFASAEFYIKTRNAAKAAGENVKVALEQELKFTLAFSGSKPVNKKKGSVGDEAGVGSEGEDYGFTNRSNGTEL